MAEQTRQAAGSAHLRFSGTDLGPTREGQEIRNRSEPPHVGYDDSVDNLVNVDPDPNEVTRLFQPRRDRGDGHFASEGPRFVGRTAVGRATAWLRSK
jgi:hypothetical protein